MSLRRPIAAIAALVITTSIASCSDDEEPSGLATPDTTSSAPPEPTETPTPTAEPTETSSETDAEFVSEERVLADYERATDAYVAAYNPADPNDPDLLARLDGDALENTQADLQSLVDEGHSYEGPEFNGDPTVMALAPDSALIRDCYRDESQLIDTETGEPIGDPETSVEHVDVTLVPKDDRWVITDVRGLEEECTPPE